MAPASPQSTPFTANPNQTVHVLKPEQREYLERIINKYPEYRLSAIEAILKLGYYKSDERKYLNMLKITKPLIKK